MATSIALAIAITAVSWAALAGEVVAGLRRQAADALFPSERLDDRVFVVGIDAKSILEAAQPWPWPRRMQADLIRNLTDAGAILIALDILYHPETDEDADLAAAIEAAGVVVVASVSELSVVRRAPLLRARTVTAPVTAIAEVADVGHANITPDSADGVVRAVPVAVEDDDGRITPALSLVALSRLEALSGPVILRPHGVEVGGRFIPTGTLARLEVNYSEALAPGAGGVPYRSAIDVIRGRLAPGELRGRVVLVGVAEPTIGDHHLTPTNKVGGMPGVFVQANVLNTMLTGSYLRPSSRLHTLGWVFVLALIIALATQFLRLWIAALLGVFLVAAHLLFAVGRFDDGVLIDLVYPSAAMLLAFVGALTLRHGRAASQRRHLAGVLSQYVPPAVARQLLSQQAGELPAGTITFLFTDVVGSTALWESDPKAMSRSMRRHDALIEAAVAASDGAVVRPRGEGDSRFAVFVRPCDAVDAAVEISVSFSAENWPTRQPIQLRTALHTGEADLREGDYYGSAVNRCARIRSVAEPGQVLLSGVTAEAVDGDLAAGVKLQPIGAVELKDFAAPEELSELLLEAGATSKSRWRASWAEPSITEDVDGSGEGLPNR